MKNDYSDIIDLPRPNIKHPRMSLESRSAQFSPFSALVGYDDAVKEIARLTDNKIDVDESFNEKLNLKLQIIQNNIKSKPKVLITYFIPDERKNGGKYVERRVNIKKIDTIEQYIVLIDKTKIPLDNIISIESEEMKLDDEYYN